MTWGSPLSQLDALRKLGPSFPGDGTELAVVVHAGCGNPIATLVSPQRPRWLWGPVLVSREPTEIPNDWSYDIDGTIDFFQLVRGLTIPGRIALWCADCRRRDDVETRALRAAGKRSTAGTVGRIRTVIDGQGR